MTSPIHPTWNLSSCFARDHALYFYHSSCHLIDLGYPLIFPKVSFLS